MSKITAEHLQRIACVYIRQSTPDQLVHNLESQRRQYGLADRARQLGWTTVEIIDDDLGRSGGGVVRPGFERHCHVGDFYLSIARRAYRPQTGKSMAWGVPRWHWTPPESAILGERDNALRDPGLH
jgi:hypothetical protein